MIERFIQYIQAEKRYSEHTVMAYKRDLEQFSSFLKKQYEIEDFLSVNSEIVCSYIIDLKDTGLKNRSVNRKISALRSFYNYCLHDPNLQP